MIFAPWCPHCHKCMPAFYEASNDATIPFAIINAELVHSELFAGDSRLCDLKHFPTIAMIERGPDMPSAKILAEAPTKENILKHANSTAGIDVRPFVT